MSSRNSCNFDTLSDSVLTTDSVTFNTAVGVTTLASANPPGALRNTAMGYQALNALTTGDDNTAVGTSSLTANTTEIQNTAVGVNVLTTNTTGNYNTSVGYSSLSANTTGFNNYSGPIGLDHFYVVSC
jgi:hypothetical protein